MAEANSYATFASAVYPAESSVLDSAPTYGDAINVLNGSLDVDAAANLPPVGRVREAVTFGSALQFTGTSHLPSAGQVSIGVGFGEDSTEFIGTLDAGYPPPADPALANLLFTVVDEYGQPEPGATVEAWIYDTPPGSLGVAFDAKPQLAVADAQGVAELQVVRLATYKIRRGDQPDTVLAQIPDVEVTSVDSIIGKS